MSDFFPYNLLYVLRSHIQALPDIDEDLVVLRRPASTSQSGTVGIFPLNWRPGEYGIGQMSPFDGSYVVGVTALLRHSDREEGEELSARTAKTLRDLVLRDQTLRSELMQLREGDQPPFERMAKFSVLQQMFADDEMNGEFIFMSGLEIAFTTELVG